MAVIVERILPSVRTLLNSPGQQASARLSGTQQVGRWADDDDVGDGGGSGRRHTRRNADGDRRRDRGEPACEEMAASVLRSASPYYCKDRPINGRIGEVGRVLWGKLHDGDEASWDTLLRSRRTSGWTSR